MKSDTAKILVVEDEPGVLRAVQRVLSSQHEVVPAQRVAEALECLGREAFDIAIVDLQLPDGSGYDVNREIQRLRPDTDVILMTGSTTHQDQKLFQALEQDAFYFLFKPFDRRVLIALVERCLRQRRLQRENFEHLARLARDQEKARAIQRSLLPETPLTAHGWLVTARFEPAEEVSGDLYSVLPLGGEREGEEPKGLAVLVADVVGHGLPAAMYAGMLRSTFDAARRLDPEPEAVFERLFEGLDFFASNSGASLFYGVFYPDGRFCYLNAGHPPALLCRKKKSGSGELEHLASTGPKLLPAPVVRRLPRHTGEVVLAPGDRLPFYTDGLPEAKSPENRELELAGVEAIFAAVEGNAEEAMDGILSALERHCEGRPVEDDVTVLLVERRD